MFGKTSNARPPKNIKNQASILRGPRSDINMPKFIPAKLEWTPNLISAFRPDHVGDTVVNIVGLNATTEVAAPSYSVNRLAPMKSLSSREQHERSHWAALNSPPFAAVPYAKMNYRMLQRCRKGYLFDCEKNRRILMDDPWLQDIWLWIEGM